LVHKVIYRRDETCKKMELQIGFGGANGYSVPLVETQAVEDTRSKQDPVVIATFLALVPYQHEEKRKSTVISGVCEHARVDRGYRGG